jgi:tetratricopeptide (TPR) repeat protein
MKMILAAALAIGLAGGSASAAISVLGGGQAEDCFLAVKAGRFDNTSMDLCNMALDTEVLSPQDRGGTLVNRGVMKLLRGDYEGAHADLNAGIALIPRVGEGWINRGAMFLSQRRYKEALADIDKAISLGLKEPAKAYYNRAIAYEGLDDETAAYLDYQQALVLKPGWDLPQHELLRFTVTRR